MKKIKHKLAYWFTLYTLKFMNFIIEDAKKKDEANGSSNLYNRKEKQ